jgi:hypothetical protein
LLPVVVSLLLTCLAAEAPAQISPVRLSVNKNRKVEQKTTSQQGGYAWSWREQAVNERVYYSIEVANASTAPLSNLRVKWAVVVQPANRKEPQLIEGERACSLNLSQKFAFDTDVIELSGKKWETSDGQYRRDDSSKILGYAVEVFLNDKRVAADIQPTDTKRKIEELKGGKESQKTHQF